MRQQAKLEKKKNRYMHIDEMGLEEHERMYEELRKKREEEREKKLEEYHQEE